MKKLLILSLILTPVCVCYSGQYDINWDSTKAYLDYKDKAEESRAREQQNETNRAIQAEINQRNRENAVYRWRNTPYYPG